MMGATRFLFFTRRFSNKISEAESLLKVADDFMQKGEVRAAESIYKTIIEKNPKYKPAYQRLWDSWVVHRTLQVTKKELDEFIVTYQENINPSNNSPAQLK